MIGTVLFFVAAFFLGSSLIYRFKLLVPSTYLYIASLVVGTVFLTLLIFGSGFLAPLTKEIIILELVVVVVISLLIGQGQRVYLKQFTYFTNSFKRQSSFIKIISFGLVILIVWLFGRALFFNSQGQLIAGDRLVWTDWPLHIGMASSFAFGQNIPPQNPTFASTPLIYPFFADFLSGIFLMLGASIPVAFAIGGIVLTLSFFALFIGFVKLVTKSVSIGVISLLLSLFWGGVGFVYWLQDVIGTGSIYPEREFSFWGEKGLWFFTFLYSEILPQRAFLFGLPMFFLILVLIVNALAHHKNFLVPQLDRDIVGASSKSNRPSSEANGENFTWFAKNIRSNLIFAGVFAGLLPFFHTHTFLSLWISSLSFVGLHMLFGSLEAFKEKLPLKKLLLLPLTLYAYFFIPFTLLSLAQLPFFLGKSGVAAFEFGWMKDGENFFLFWFKNTGFFMPIMLMGIWQGRKNKILLGIGLVSIILFIIPNLFRFAPWGYDNLKMLTYWYLLGSIFVALVLVRFFQKNFLGKLVASILFFSLTLTGFLEVGRLFTTSKTQIGLWSREDFLFAENIKKQTDPQSIFLTAAIHDHPVASLAGRKIVIGYPGNSWSWGIRGWDQREQDVRTMFRGGELARSLWKKYRINYIIVSDRERYFEAGVDEEFIKQNAELVIEISDKRVYKIK